MNRQEEELKQRRGKKWSHGSMVYILVMCSGPKNLGASMMCFESVFAKPL